MLSFFCVSALTIQTRNVNKCSIYAVQSVLTIDNNTVHLILYWCQYFVHKYNTVYNIYAVYANAFVVGSIVTRLLFGMEN